MSFLKNAQLLIPEISHLALTVSKNDTKTLEDFENSFCFSPSLQPLYTSKGLQSFFVQERKEKNRIYEVTDTLDTHVILMNTSSGMIILEPYVTTSWHETAAKELLIKRGLQADVLMPYKVYRCSLPITQQLHAEHIAFLILKNITDDSSLKPIHINMTAQETEDLPFQIPEEYREYEEVNQRYIFEIRTEIAQRKRGIAASQSDGSVYYRILSGCPKKSAEYLLSLCKTCGSIHRASF